MRDGPTASRSHDAPPHHGGVSCSSGRHWGWLEVLRDNGEAAGHRSRGVAAVNVWALRTTASRSSHAAARGTAAGSARPNCDSVTQKSVATHDATYPVRPRSASSRRRSAPWAVARAPLSRPKAWIYGSWTKWPSIAAAKDLSRACTCGPVRRQSATPSPSHTRPQPVCPRPRPTHHAQLRRPTCPNVLAFNLEGGVAWQRLIPLT